MSLCELNTILEKRECSEESEIGGNNRWAHRRNALKLANTTPHHTISFCIPHTNTL